MTEPPCLSRVNRSGVPKGLKEYLQHSIEETGDHIKLAQHEAEMERSRYVLAESPWVSHAPLP
jgi:hypothetical protein